MKYLPTIGPVIASIAVSATSLNAQVTWLLNHTNNIGGNPVTMLSGNPVVTNTPQGDAVWFDGVNDGLKVSTNPIAGMTNFTVEMVFRPDPTNHASATQPRVFHIQSPNPPDHRLTLEARIVGNQWYADTFLRTSGTNSLALQDPAKLHPVGEWHHLAVTYDGAQFSRYVNGVLELSGAISAEPLANGESSIGMRANLVNYFEGAVLTLRFTPRALATNEFKGVPGR